MRVSRSVIDDEKNASQRETFNQTIEKSLGFIVDPVQVLKYSQHGLSLALSDKHPFHCIQSVTAALLGDPSN